MRRRFQGPRTVAPGLLRFARNDGGVDAAIIGHRHSIGRNGYVRTAATGATFLAVKKSGKRRLVCSPASAIRLRRQHCGCGRPDDRRRHNDRERLARSDCRVPIADRLGQLFELMPMSSAPVFLFCRPPPVPAPALIRPKRRYGTLSKERRGQLPRLLQFAYPAARTIPDRKASLHRSLRMRLYQRHGYCSHPHDRPAWRCSPCGDRRAPPFASVHGGACPHGGRSRPHTPRDRRDAHS